MVISIRGSGHIYKRMREGFSAEVVHKLGPNDSRISQKTMRGSVPEPAWEEP